MTDRTYTEILADLDKTSKQIWHLSEQLNNMLSSNEAALAAIGRESYGEVVVSKLERDLEAEEDRHEALSHELAIVFARMAA